MKRRIGFSTGALAHGDFRRALCMLQPHAIEIVELSALRQPELLPLINSLEGLDLSSFTYIAFHAPSQIEPQTEKDVVYRLMEVADRGWPIVVHPDVIQDYTIWRPLRSSLCVENMDNRKSIGRTAAELERIFNDLPDARLCLDIGHARQVDSTMTEAYLILRQYTDKLVQVHVSEVNTRSRHDILSYSSILAFQEIAAFIPEDVPLILETPVPESQLESEIERVREALPTSVLAA